MSEPITKSLVVAADSATAFRTWIEEIDLWWPRSHSRSKNAATRIVLEGRAGGRFYERAPDGREFEYGSVLTYDPPHRLVYHWFLGTDQDHPTLVDVSFVSVPGGTRIDVEHRAGSAGIEAWTGRKSGYARAWIEVLSCYERAAVNGARP